MHPFLLAAQPKPIGPIELQQHYRNDGKPGNIWFKNIYIKDKDLPE